MKKILIIITSLSLLACNNVEERQQEESNTTTNTVETIDVDSALSGIAGNNQKSTNTVSFDGTSSGEYQFENHANFKIFWADFKKAVLANDKEAVAKMTLIPFRDEYQEAYYSNYGGEKPLTANSKSEFLNMYDKIILSDTKAAVQSDKYRGYVESNKDEEWDVEETLSKGEYVLEFETNNGRSYNLLFKKKNGKYKLDHMPYYP
jgi:hypothetical protein